MINVMIKLSILFIVLFAVYVESASGLVAGIYCNEKNCYDGKYANWAICCLSKAIFWMCFEVM